MAKLPVELWKVEPIQYLVLWKFPELAAFSWKNSQDKAPINSEEYRSLLDKTERYRESLGEMPQHEIDRLVTRARKEEAEKYKAYRANEEEQRRFNLPSAKADFVYWASASYWSQDEAVALSFGRDPRHVPWSAIKPFVNISPFAKTFADRREIVCRAITMGQLGNPASLVGSGPRVAHHAAIASAAAASTASTPTTFISRAIARTVP